MVWAIDDGTMAIKFAGNPDGLTSDAGTYQQDGEWHHIVWVLDTTQQYLYYDGVEIISGLSSVSLPYTIQELVLLRTNHEDEKGIEAIMDDVVVSTRAWTPAEVLNVYESTTAYDGDFSDVDYSANLVSYWKMDDDLATTVVLDDEASNDGTLNVNTDVASVSGKVYKALEFDGADSSIVVSDDASIQNIFDSGATISAWVNANNDGESNWGAILHKSLPGNDGWTFQVNDDDGTNTKVRFLQYHDGDDGSWTTTNRSLPLDSWHHLALTYNNSETSTDPILYIDGEVVALTETGTPSGTRTTDASNNLYIGNSSGDNVSFDGEIDEVRIHDIILPKSYVEELATPQPTEFTFTAVDDVLVGSGSFNVSFSATSTAGVIQACGLFSPYDLTYFWETGVSGQNCDLIEEVGGVNLGNNEFYGVLQINFETFYSDPFNIVGYIDPDLDPLSPSAIPTMNFTTANSTTTIGVENVFHLDGYDDVRVLNVQIYDPQINETIVYTATTTTAILEVEYNWTPETAGSYTFWAGVYDSHGQIGYPSPSSITIEVIEDVVDEITVPVIDPVLEPDQHFLIDSAQTLISFLHLDDIWNWFVSLFKQKFPFSWFYAIFNIWDIERDTIKDLSAESALTVSWTFPTSTPAFAGSTFNLFDLETARTTYSSFFALIRIILINIFWLGFAFLLIGKVKKFINDMSIND